MNALYTGPGKLATSEALKQYFVDMERWGFDIACCTYSAYPRESVIGSMSAAYRGLAEGARSCGIPACVCMDISRCRVDMVDISEAQHHLDNLPETLPDSGFFASFASERWREYLSGLISLFVSDFGFDWVLLEEPICRVDIPGSLDRFYKLFHERWPTETYPDARRESSAYLKLQQAKCDVMLAFCDGLVTHAKSRGAARVGVTVGRFAPAIGQTSDEPASTARYDSRGLIALPNVDFVSVRRVLAAARDSAASSKAGTAAGHYESDTNDFSALTYAEVLAYAVGKPIIAVADICRDVPDPPAPSPDVIRIGRRTVVAAAAAGMNGIGAGWYPEILDDTCLKELEGGVHHVLHRTPNQHSPAAFVFSASSTRHAEPYDYAGIWPHYWSLMRYLIGERGWPTLTVSADALRGDLAMSPQLRLLVLEEHFPLTAEQVEVVLDWWKREPGRGLVIVGTGVGLSADPEKPGEQPITEAFPGLLEHIGLKLADPPTLDLPRSEPLRLVLRGVRRANMPADGEELNVRQIANINRVFGMGVRILYTDPEGRPLIVKWRSGDTAAYFIGLGSSQETAPLIGQVMYRALMLLGSSSPPVVISNKHLLWNSSKEGYVVVGNCRERPAQATIARRPNAYWDVTERKAVRDESVHLDIGPNSVRVIRWITKTSKVYDVEGAVYVKSISAGAGRAEIVLRTCANTRFLLRSAPRKVLVDGLHCPHTSVDHGDFTEVSLHDLPPDDHVVTIMW